METHGNGTAHSVGEILQARRLYLWGGRMMAGRRRARTFASLAALFAAMNGLARPLQNTILTSWVFC